MRLSLKILSVVRNNFEAIHATFRNPSVKGTISLPDDDNIWVDYEHLLRLKKSGKTDYWPDGASRQYRVQDLLGELDVKAPQAGRVPAKADLLCQCAALLGVVWCHHGIVSG